MADAGVSIIVRAWGEQLLTRECIRSLHQSGSPEAYEVILVDQDPDRSQDLWDPRELCDFVVITQENHGAVTATNLGLQIAMTRPSDLVLVLDNDTRIPDGDIEWLRRWVRHFDDKEIGAAGATTDYVSGMQRIQDVPRTHTKAVESEDGRTFTGPILVPWLISFACMYRKEALLSMPSPDMGVEAISSAGSVMPDGTFNQSLKDWQRCWLWDERFNPGNSEDIDVCIRMQTRGWKLTVARDVYIHHRGSTTFRKGDFQGLLARNRQKLLDKWGEAVLERLGVVRRTG